jgi:hypothetical protein
LHEPELAPRKFVHEVRIKPIGAEQSYSLLPVEPFTSQCITLDRKIGNVLLE